MIKKEKIENQALYSKWGTDWESNIKCGDFKGESINMFCEYCDSYQTFNCGDAIFNGSSIFGFSSDSGIGKKESINGTLYLEYKCAHCNNFVRDFLFKITKGTEIEKIGQFPSIDIDIPRELKSFGKKEIEQIYRKGRMLENQGYGIGAFAYYRRIVELCVYDLIEDIKNIIPAEKKDEYEKIIKKLKDEKIAKNKIDLIKDTIVDTAIDGNPLSKLYELSSIGIHDLNDEKCLEYAESLRTLLIYVIDEISREKNKKDGLKKAMEKIEKLISNKR